MAFLLACQKTNCTKVQKVTISNNQITTIRKLPTHTRVHTCVYAWICNYILNRFPFHISLLGLQLYLTQIRCYQNRLKWCVLRWQEMVEVITSQRPLSNHPGKLPQCITEFARHVCKESCVVDEAVPKWSLPDHKHLGI